MNTQLLKDPTITPTDEVLRKLLKKNADNYELLMETIQNPPFDLTIEWRYYNDGKAWLCKVVHKKKTVFWLSVWEGFFKTTFFFTEKTKDGLLNLDISEDIKKTFQSQKNTGKLIPLLIDINKKQQLKDVFKIIEYKKSLK